MANLKQFLGFNSPRTCEASKFIYDFAKKSKRNMAYKRSYRNTARHLVEYGKNRGSVVMSNSFNYNTIEDFVFYLKDKNLMLSTISSIVSKLAASFRRMDRAGYEVDFGFLEYDLQEEDSNAVYLTTEEIERLFKLNLKSPESRIIRDLFIVGCCTGMRFSDYSRLTDFNVSEGTIQRRTQKSANNVIIPIHVYVKSIMKYYKGNFPDYTKSKQNFNARIKTLCKKANITSKVLWERTVGHNVVRKSFKKYDLVGSHTARRSFATNAYLAGILPAKIMLFTGHKTETAFFKYIRIGKEENARELKSHSFFTLNSQKNEKSDTGSNSETA